MVTSIELQVISKLLTSDSAEEVNALCEYDASYYSVFKEHIEFILDHRQKYGEVPDVFTFQSEFPDVSLVKVTEPLTFLHREMKRNKQHILLVTMFNKLKDLTAGDVEDAWRYIAMEADKASKLECYSPLDIVKDAKQRSELVVEHSRRARIPTGFAEIDKLMYGGLSTVEELLLIVARTNTGKSWVCTKMMEAAQAAGYPVLYYSPEMQSAYLGTRFDTWRGHFQNSQLHQGKYSDQYIKYIHNLSSQETSAFVIEDKDMPDGVVSVPAITNLVRKHGIKEVIIDGLSYMHDVRQSRSDTDYTKYKNLCLDLFRMSKEYGCAVVITMQANRETRECKDDKGDPFPNLYNVEGSDHPARIATQAFALRQVFDKHVLDIRLEKSRNAANQKPVFSYAWDVNTGNVQYLPGGDDSSINKVISPISVNNGVSSHTADSDASILSEDDFDDVEF